MDNEHIKDTIKDYEIGTIFRNETNLSQGQADEKNTKTALLSDFQLVEVSGKNLQSGRGDDTDVCDSAYYHHRNRNKRTCITAYRFSDFIDKARAGADSFWIYTKDADATYDDDLWDYRNSSYTETFNPQTYTEYAASGNISRNNPYGVYRWEEPTWEFLN